MRSRRVRIVAISLALMAAGCTKRPGAPHGQRHDAPWTFTDVTEFSGLSAFRHVMGGIGELWLPESIGAGAAFVDYDGDDHQDIVLVRGGALAGEVDVPALDLFRNRGDGTFENRTAAAGLAQLRAYGLGVYPGDVDNDGDADLLLTTLERNVLLINEGSRFRDATRESGLEQTSEWSTAAVFFDADRDGHLDLFVGNYVRWTPQTDRFCSLDGEAKSYCTPRLYQEEPGRYYHNNGDGTFTDRTIEAGFAGTPGNTLGAVSFDYNRDGWPDLFVANDLKPNLLYRNNGNGTFREIGVQSGVAFDERGNARAGMGTDAAVVDTTGEVTIFVGNFSREPIGVYRYLGGDAFLNRDVSSRLLRSSVQTLTFSLFLFDADLDGDLDLFAVNGHVQTDIEKTEDRITHKQPPHLFLNVGDGTFADAASALGVPLTTPIAGRGGAFADFDRDGDLDVLVTENNGPAHLWRNDLRRAGSQEPYYLRVALEGSRSNRDAVGATVALFAEDRVLVHEMRGGGGFLSANERTLTFGLGPSAVIDSVRVDWPLGRRTKMVSVSPNQMVRIVEPHP